MDTTIDALKNLYVALGGTASTVADITIIPDMINAIAALISSGATAELPKVTSTDNGSALLVSSGEWAKGELPKELPSVSSPTDDGKVLTVVNGAWAAAALPD